MEPIEYMTPYPNLRGLVEGQNVKHHGKMIFADMGMTNHEFYAQVQKTANWLVSTGLKPKERVWVHPLQFPHTELLVFGVWTVGASVILAADPAQNFDHIITADKSHLEDEAMIFVSNDKGVRLSHYNLLVNANDVQRKLNLYDDGTFYIELEPNSTAWAVLQAVFPLYTGAPLTKKNPDITIGLNDADYIVDFSWTEIEDSNHLYILPENTAVLTVGNQGLHLTSFELKGDQLTVNGHSVMMGYMDDNQNEAIFRDGSMVI